VIREAPMTSALDVGDCVRTGLAFSGSSYAFRIALDLGTSVALARMLAPVDFGIVAVAATFLQVSYVVGNMGMSGAVIQATALSENDRHAAYIISGLSGLLLTGLGIVAGPWAAGFFSMPVLRVALPIMSAQMFLSGLSAMPMALLRRQLLWGRVAAVDIASGVLYSFVSIGMAAVGYGVWSLVWPPIVSGLFALIALHVMTRYRPRFVLERAAVRRLTGFGGTLTAKNVFVHLGRHADDLVVARSLGAAATGLYTKAFGLSTLPQQRLVSMLYGVCLPVFCRLKGQDDLFRDWYVKATTAVAVIVSPLLLGLVVVADDFTAVVFGPPWIAMAPCLRILCVASLLSSLHMLGGAAIEATGRLRYEVATQVIYATLIPLASVIGSRYGIQGVAWGVLIASVALYLMKAATLRAAIGLSPRRYLSAVGAPVLAALVMCGGVLLAAAAMASWSPAGGALRLVLDIVAGALIYPAALWIIRRDHFLLVAHQIVLVVERAVPPMLRPRAIAS
jgi:O-antigen/teichoic acid export membrane protein